jgi:hypothetical protein
MQMKIFNFSNKRRAQELIKHYNVHAGEIKA